MGKEIALRTDSEWSQIDSKLCLVNGFTSLLGATVKNGEVITVNKTSPYASIDIECSNYKDRNITGFVTQKIDFMNLWEIFQTKGINSSEEVLMYWSKEHYKGKLTKFLSKGLPKMVLLVCPKGTFSSLPEGLTWQGNDEAMVLVYGLLATAFYIPGVIN